MAVPLAKTFQILTTTANPFAGEVLIAALDVPLPSIQLEAVKSLVIRGGVREQIEAVRRYGQFPAKIRRELEESTQALVPAIRQCLVVGRGDLEHAALELARTGEAFGIIEALLGILRGDDANLQAEAVETLRHLVNRLYGHLHGLHTSDSYAIRNPSQFQHLTLTALDEACQFFHELAYAEDVVESILVLGGPGHFASQKVLSQGSAECRALAKELLQTSRHPGVMRFLLDSLSKPYPPSRVIDAVQTRTDPEFILAAHPLGSQTLDDDAGTQSPGDRAHRLADRERHLSGIDPRRIANRADDVHFGDGFGPGHQNGGAGMDRAERLPGSPQPGHRRVG